MPGKRITEQQIRLYMTLINEGKTQRAASAKSGLSERTGRRISKGELIIAKSSHHWRTRQDPLADVWDSQLVPLLENTPSLLPLTLFEWLGDNYPDINGFFHYPRWFRCVFVTMILVYNFSRVVAYDVL